MAAELQERSDGEVFQPWTGWLTLDKDEIWFVDDTPTTDDDVDGQVPDLFTNAMHELGYILGVGTSPAFLNYAADGFFTGPASVEVYGGPVPVPVTATGQHLMDGFEFDGFEFDGEKPLMNRTDANGDRHRPTLLDIGYEVEREGKVTRSMWRKSQPTTLPI
ncbi:MAG: hypothetical protein GY822_05950 [Deltaproteobacteria bacterium]|nr:hypothetical protein [Deltaproteobacteria bacterium]